MQAGGTFCEVACDAEQLAAHRAAWEDFSKRQLEDDVYLSLPFLLATLRQYGERRPVRVVLVYREDGSGRVLIGLAPFCVVRGDDRLPFPVLSTLVSPHGYLSHPALDREDAARAWRAIWEWTQQPQHPWRAVLFEKLPDRSPLWPLLRAEASRSGRRIWIQETSTRSMLRRVDSFEAYLASLGRQRRRSFRRKWGKLESEHGVRVELHRGGPRSRELAERFMALEATTWKGEQGTALASTPADRAFFEELIVELGERGALFCVELVVGDEPVAITVNLVDGRTLFAFKVAYDPRFHAYSPGILAELQTVRLFLESDGLDVGEAGTSGASYIDDYWNDSTELCRTYLATGDLFGRLALRGLEAATGLKRRALEGRRGARGVPSEEREGAAR